MQGSVVLIWSLCHSTFRSELWIKTEAALLRVQVTQGSEKWQLLYCRRRHNYGARTEAGGTLPHNGYTPTIQGKRAGKTEA